MSTPTSTQPQPQSPDQRQRLKERMESSLEQHARNVGELENRYHQGTLNANGFMDVSNGKTRLRLRCEQFDAQLPNESVMFLPISSYKSYIGDLIEVPSPLPILNPWEKPSTDEPLGFRFKDLLRDIVNYPFHPFFWRLTWNTRLWPDQKKISTWGEPNDPRYLHFNKNKQLRKWMLKCTREALSINLPIKDEVWFYKQPQLRERLQKIMAWILYYFEKYPNPATWPLEVIAFGGPYYVNSANKVTKNVWWDITRFPRSLFLSHMAAVYGRLSPQVEWSLISELDVTFRW